MIRAIQQKSLEHKPWTIIWSIVVFLGINYLVFLAFMNVCFQRLVTGEPIYITILSLCLMGIDTLMFIFMTKKLLTINNIIDAIVLFLLILSLSLYGLFPKLVYIQITAIIKLKEIFIVNRMLYKLVSKNSFLWKLYVIIKIVYWILLVGHIIGCLFYALDIYLIRNQYFGPLELNPQVYYQGYLHAYTAIQVLSEKWRYVYAVYYSFSLLSTVAFGDIIGHNYLEDVLVSVFLIVATIGISLIIQQMYIVFRREKVKYYEVISKTKYVSEYLKSQQNIKDDFRYQLVNYMIDSQWKGVTSIPRLDFLTLKLQNSIFSQSILSKTDQQLPIIIRKSFLQLLKANFFPAHYFILDYTKLENHIFGFLFLKSQFNIGYTKKILGKVKVKKECICFGFGELILQTNYLNRHLVIQLTEQTQVFTLSDDDFINKMTELRNYFNQYLPTPIEYFQISKDQALKNLQVKKQCTFCQIKGHSLIDCQNFHYNPREACKKQLYIKIKGQKRSYKGRRNIISKKNTSMKSIHQYRQKNGQNDLTIHFQLLKKVFNEANLFQNLFSKTIIHYSDQNSLGLLIKDQAYHIWKAYAPDGNLQH